VNPSDLRRALGLFATGVTVLTAVDPDTWEPRGMTANAFMSGSLDPPLILVSVKLTARLHSVLGSGPPFGVSVLPVGLEREARRFAGVPLPAGEPEPVLQWHAGVPVLDGAIAWFAADVVDRHLTGDHSLFIGQVRAFDARTDGAAPLVFHRSRFGHLIEESEPLPTDPWGWTVDLWG
jgi:flavin reductase (DIM6/NTAB) family NADH-FMN oxidoreductase RutF